MPRQITSCSPRAILAESAGHCWMVPLLNRSAISFLHCSCIRGCPFPKTRVDITQVHNAFLFRDFSSAEKPVRRVALKISLGLLEKKTPLQPKRRCEKAWIYFRRRKTQPQSTPKPARLQTEGSGIGATEKGCKPISTSGELIPVGFWNTVDLPSSTFESSRLAA